MNDRNQNRRKHACVKGFSMFLLAGAFLISSEMPLLADPPQSSQPSAPGQKQDDSLPDAPQAQPPQTPSGQQTAPAPSGTAGAKAADVKGAPVAQPTGAAVAPARQHGHRSLLIKVGLLVGAGVAVGSAVALSERSPSRPPGASAAIRP
jgi:hypothetical protein